MNLVAWVLQNFIEPFFWSALQWIWSFKPNFEQAELPIQFYSYSATSLLLWFYEKLPHSVVLGYIRHWMSNSFVAFQWYWYVALDK